MVTKSRGFDDPATVRGDFAADLGGCRRFKRRSGNCHCGAQCQGSKQKTSAAVSTACLARPVPGGAHCTDRQSGCPEPAIPSRVSGAPGQAVAAARATRRCASLRLRSRALREAPARRPCPASRRCSRCAGRSRTCGFSAAIRFALHRAVRELTRVDARVSRPGFQRQTGRRCFLIRERREQRGRDALLTPSLNSDAREYRGRWFLMPLRTRSPASSGSINTAPKFGSGFPSGPRRGGRLPAGQIVRADATGAEAGRADVRAFELDAQAFHQADGANFVAV